MEALHLFLLGEQQRKVGETKLNLNSSRSHIIFSLRCIRIDQNGSPSRVNTLSLVDLAGSERQVSSPNQSFFAQSFIQLRGTSLETHTLGFV